MAIPRPAAARWTWADAVVAAGVLALLYAVVRTGAGAAAPFAPPAARRLDADPADLPYYAARSLLRMFAALAVSLLCSLAWAYAAAHSRRLERVLIPALDVLQAVPVLAFLTVAATGSGALFPGSALGPECAAVFAIFTSQAWNMTFAFYHSLITTPRELDELARNLRFTRWMRFWKIELPSGAIPLVWNGMMSFGGGWFFLVAAEMVTLGGRDRVLPGIGSYAGAAIAAGDLGDVGWAILAMTITVAGVNFLFWRPLVAWAERFKVEQSEAVRVQRSLVLDLLRRSRWPRLLGRALAPLRDGLNTAGRLTGVRDRPLRADVRHGPRGGDVSRGRAGDAVFWTAVLVPVGWGVLSLVRYLDATTGLGVLVEPLLLGLATLARVAVLVVVATVVWVPIGVKIGFSPRLTRVAQPLVQVLASFPANFLFPLATWFFVRSGVPLDVGGVLLMALGAQWYILFNTIAGAMAVPADLREAMDDLGVRGVRRWRRLIVPGIFPAYVTGAVTASGGAWNASIVAEVVTFGGTTLTATGLGAYISRAAESGDAPRLIAGVAVMSLYVIAVNALLWRRLYRLAERRYSLD